MKMVFLLTRDIETMIKIDIFSSKSKMNIINNKDLAWSTIQLAH